MSEQVIQVAKLTKRFDGVLAVDALDFTVAAGRTVALLGANGAGKTTTLAMMLGLLLPTSGSVRVLGADMAKERHKVMARINFSSPYVDLPRRLTVEQNLRFFAQLYGVPKARERIRALADELGMGAFMKQRMGRLSAGQKTRAALAKSLVNSPDLLFLDEPTASLDPDTGDWVRSYLEAYRRESGCAIVLASHNMSEVERLCDDVLMMRRGRIVDRGTPQALIGRYGRRTLEEVFLDIARERRLASDPSEAAE